MMRLPTRRRAPGRRFAGTAVTVALLGLGLGALPAAPASARTIVKTGPQSSGYLMLTSNGGVFDFNTLFFGAPASDPSRCAPAPLAGRAAQPNGTCGSIAAEPSGNGYWVLNSVTGAIYPFGNVHLFGTPQARFAASHTSPEFMPVMRQIVSTPNAQGYWVYEVGASGLGHVDVFGNAGYFEDTSALVTHGFVRGFNGQPVAMAATPTGKGYWEVYSDGGVFAFGDARFAGSMASKPLAAPIVGIVSTATGKGYWLVASDGGVFAFGDAKFSGSMAGQAHAPIVSMVSNPTGPGYWLVSDNGQVFTFGGTTFFGTLSTLGVHGHVAAVASAPSNFG